MNIFRTIQKLLHIGAFSNAKPGFLTVVEPAPVAHHAGGRPSIPVDRAQAEAMLRAGIPRAEVARRLGIKAPTLFNRIREWAANPQPEPIPEHKPVEQAPAMPAIRPIEALRPVVPPVTVEPLPNDLQAALGGLLKPAPTARPPALVNDPPATIPEPEAPPLHYWATALSKQRREFLLLTEDVYPVTFLVPGEMDAQMAWNCQQPCLGIDEWHPGHERHPAIQSAKTIYVALHQQDYDRNLQLLTALAHSPLRERCSVAFLSNPLLWTFQARMRLMSEYAQRPETGERIFAGTERWRPLPSNRREVEKLVPKPKPSEPDVNAIPFHPSWELPQVPELLQGPESWRLR